MQRSRASKAPRAAHRRGGVSPTARRGVAQLSSPEHKQLLVAPSTVSAGMRTACIHARATCDWRPGDADVAPASRRSLWCCKPRSDDMPTQLGLIPQCPHTSPPAIAVILLRRARDHADLSAPMYSTCKVQAPLPFGPVHAAGSAPRVARSCGTGARGSAACSSALLPVGEPAVARQVVARQVVARNSVESGSEDRLCEPRWLGCRSTHDHAAGPPPLLPACRMRHPLSQRVSLHGTVR